MRGADIEQLRGLATDFRTKAGELRGLISFLDGKTSSSESFWKGPKADGFRTEWTNVKPQFENFANALDDAASAADNNATNIENAT